uniref:NADH dehydrogenase subunit 6 n=1 Tax=Parasitus fimetorum TaxID=2022322 RepID=UPI001FAFF274|nr:NADH dehydrogenase subunit 6 [Parasitus fimetorum]UKO33179.1 NADH dehydrogenase subunit 6 [Parasitus fimetorum]
MKLLLILGTLFCANTHPIALIILLICATLTASMMISTFLKSSWFSLIFILIMLGGMLILFIYIASLASNEPFMKNKILYLAPFILFLPSFKNNYMNNFFENSLYTLFSTSSSFNNYMAILYLLLSLLVVIEIISCYKAPLRSNN